MGNKFRDTLSWFYTSYLPSYRCLKTAFDEAALVDIGGHIVLCEQQLSNVTVQDLVERITSSMTVTPIKVLPKILVVKSKDKFRVECLKYSKLGESLYFPSAGVEINKFKNDLVYFSDDKSFAIMKTMDSAVQMARALLKDNEAIAKKKEHTTKQQSLSPPPFSSTTISPTAAPARVTASCSSAASQPPQPACIAKKAPRKNSMSTTGVDHSNSCLVEVQYLEDPPVSQSLRGLRTYVFQVIGHSADQSTEKLVDVESLESHPSSVSVTVDPCQVSLSILTKELRKDYPMYTKYSLCFKDTNGILMELVSNTTTESTEFWARVRDVDFYFADLDAERSESTYDDVSEFEQCSPRLAPLECEVEEPAVGIDLDRWDLPELLAAAILLLSNRCELQIASITSPNCLVRLGPEPNSYEDSMHRYTSKHHITMHHLGFFKCRRRLTCCGIAFGIHGLASIGHILQAKFPETPHKKHIFRRLYGRLIEPVDAGVNGGGDVTPALQPNRLSAHSSLATKEAQTLEKMVNNCLPKNGGNDLCRDEAEKICQFLTALHFTQRYYTKFVGCLYNEISA